MILVSAANGALDPGRGDAIRAALLSDALLIYPTDTLYALGGLALRPAAAARVRAAKGRPDDRPLPLIASDIEQVRTLVRELPAMAETLAAAFWPGPLTLVLRAATAVPDAVTSGSGTVAVRVPALPLARTLCRLAGSLISTSANRTGEAAPIVCADAVAAVGAFAAVAVDAGPGRPEPSTIVDLTTDEPHLLREGAVSWEDVRAVGRW